MNTDEQPRDGATGRFDSKPNSAPEVALAETVDGSFLYPPSSWPGGAEQYLNFWKTQPISDEALTNFVSAYAATRDEWADPRVRRYAEDWGNTEGIRQVYRDKLSSEQARTVRGDAIDAYRAQLEAEYPERIPHSLARPIARAAQIMANRDRLQSPEAIAQVENAAVHFGRDGTPMSAKKVWEDWHLDAIMPDAFYSRENAIERQLRKLSERIG